MATTPKISQRISLEGAEQIKESLDKLGAAGKKAFSELKTAVDSANQSIDSAGKNIKAKLDGVAKAGEGAAESIFTVGQKAVLAVGGIVAIGTALVSLARSYLNAADAAAKLVSAQVAAATRAGQTRQNYERQIGTLEQLGLTHAEAEQAIKKFGAGGAEAYAKGVAELKKLGISFAPTEAGAKAASQMLGNLGDAAKDAGGKVGGATELIRRAKAVFDPLTGTLTQDQTAWENLAESVSKIQGPLQRATFLTAQFGDDLGRRLSKALSGGAAAFRKEAEDFNRISGNLSKEQVQQQNDAASAYEKAMARWTAAAQGVRTRGGLKVAEAVTPFINMMVEAELQFEKAQESFLQEGSNRFETTRRELQAIHEFLSLPLPEAWRRYSRAANEAFDQAVAAAKRGVDAIRGFIAEKGADAWNWISETAEPAWNKAKATAAEAMRIIRKATTEGEPGAWQWLLSTLDKIIAQAEAKLAALAARAKKVLTESAVQGGTTGAPGLDAGPAPSGTLTEEIGGSRRDPALRAAAGLDRLGAAAKVAKDHIISIGPTTQTTSQQASAALDRLRDAFGPVATVAQSSLRILANGTIEVARASKEGVAGVGAWKNVLAVVGPTLERIDAAQKKFSASTRDTTQAFKEGIPGVGAFANVLRVVGPTLAEIDAAQKKASASTLPLQERIKATGQAFTEMKATSATAFSEMQAGPAKVEQAMGGLSAIGQTIESSFDEAGFEITSLSSDFDQVGTKVQTVMQSVSESIASAFAPAEAAIQRLMVQLDAAIAKARDLTTTAASAGGGNGDDLGGFARGGQFRGRPGRDTNLAWLTDKEYVMPVPAVKKYGVGFMDMIRRMALPRDAFRGFNAGGLVDGLNQSLSALTIPRFAVGGLADMALARAPAASGRPFVLHMADGRQVSGVISGRQIVRALEGESIAQQSGSTGRKPSWVR